LWTQRETARQANEHMVLPLVDGEFERGEVVGCFDPNGREVARGLTNYSAQETSRILRKPSSEIESILGYIDEPELIHRTNMVLLG